MNLVGYTATALSRNDIEDTPTSKNVVDGAIVELKDLQGNSVAMYDDSDGANPETQKACDIDGQITFFAEVGDYDLEINGKSQRINLSSGLASFISTKTDESVQDFIDAFVLDIYQSPTDGVLTEIQTRTIEGFDVYEVRNSSDNSLATIYSDSSGTNEIAQDGANNISGGDGGVKFYVAEGDYYIESGGSTSRFICYLIERRATDEALWGERFVGYFEAGFTFQNSSDVGKGANGNYYRYSGSSNFPVVVPAGENELEPYFEQVIPVDKESRPIVILTSGQSNMVGSSNVLEGSTATNELVEAWNARFNQNGTDFTLAQLGQSPFNGGGQQHIGFNAAKYLAETTGREVKIINMADGGQPIEKWLDDDADDYMWQAILREVPLALNAAGVQTIDFFMWHQGEANSSDSVMDYRDKLRQLKGQLEAQEWFDGNSKFIVGGMALGSPTTGTSGARPQQNLAISLFCESDPQAIPVYTGDLITDSTGVHFTDLSIIEIGQRYAKAALSGAGSLNAQPTRYVEAATNLTYDQTNGQFRDFDDLLDFISTLNFKNGARLDVYLPAGTYNIGTQRLNFEGNLVRFIGELDGAFTTPVKADFTGTESTDLTMLQSKYLTELVFTSTNSCFVLDGSNGGYWQDLLLVSESPLFKASFVRNSDPSLFTSGGGSITLSNVAMHGLNGNSCTVIQADKGCYVDASECVVSHCDAVALANSSNVFVKGSIFAYSGQAVNSTNKSFINAFGLELIGQSGVSYVASLGSFVDASSADDSANNNTSSNGFIQV